MTLLFFGQSFAAFFSLSLKHDESLQTTTAATTPDAAVTVCALEYLDVQSSMVLSRAQQKSRRWRFLLQEVSSLPQKAIFLGVNNKTAQQRLLSNRKSWNATRKWLVTEPWPARHSRIHRRAARWNILAQSLSRRPQKTTFC